MRFRFDERELGLLRGAEHVRGASMAHTPRSDQLRNALHLARAGQKLSHAAAGSPVTLEESELALLLEAVRYATAEVQQASRADGPPDPRRDAVCAAFPELADRGSWRSFGVARELEALAARLQHALTA